MLKYPTKNIYILQSLNLIGCLFLISVSMLSVSIPCVFSVLTPLKNLPRRTPPRIKLLDIRMERLQLDLQDLFLPTNALDITEYFPHAWQVNS